MTPPTMPGRRIVAIVNAGSGGGNDDALVERLRRAFEAAGADARIVLAHGADEMRDRLDAAIAEAPDAVVAGGGDGTVSLVAGGLAGSTIALGVLPLGTLNHFAKDAGIPLDVDAAVEAIVAGRATTIDVGEVNGRVFVNNSSLGLYPDLVRDRERQQQRLGRGKWPAFVWASLGALRRYPFLDLDLELDGRRARRRTPFVFVGNNRYAMEGFSIGSRERLDEGVLSIYLAQRASRWRLAALAFRALFARLRQARDFDAVAGAELVVASRHRTLRVAVDGEVCTMSTPLRYRCRPGALRVLGGEPSPSSPSPED